MKGNEKIEWGRAVLGELLERWPKDITITSSTNMSKEDIDRAVRDAEKFAEEDKKLKEAVEVKNRAETMVIQSEKTLNDIGDKLPESDKAEVKSALEKLKETAKGNDTDAIKADTEALEKAFYALSEKLYKQQGGNPQDAGAGFEGAQGYNGGAQGADGNGNYYSQDFEDKN